MVKVTMKGGKQKNPEGKAKRQQEMVKQLSKTEINSGGTRRNS